MNSGTENLACVVADTVGIEGIRFDADNSLSLEFDGTVVTLAIVGPRLILQSELAHLSGFPDEAPLFRLLLTEDDAVTVALGNCYLAVDKAANTIDLRCVLAPVGAVGRDVLGDALGQFYELILQWRRKLNGFSLPQQGVEAGAQVPGILV